MPAKKSVPAKKPAPAQPVPPQSSGGPVSDVLALDAPSLPTSLPVPEGYVVLGEIVGVFGVRGEVRVFLFNREGDTLEKERSVRLMGVETSGAVSEQTVRMRVRSGAGKRIIGRISGIDTPDLAEKLVGLAILIPRSELPETEEGEFYVHDLIGLRVEDESGRHVGTLEDVVEGPQKDIWVIAPVEGGDALFVVAEAATVVAVEIRAGRVVVRSEALG